MRKTLLASAVLILASNALANRDLESAQALLNDGRPKEALAILAPSEADLAGEVEFDYLLALATLDSGDPSKAILVFERVLAVQPDFHGARLDLARALFAIERFDEAERELRIVAASNPPPAAQQAVDAYLGRIERRNRQLKFSRFINVAVRGGYDSNVNSATEATEFLGFRLDDASREQDSDFVEAGISVGAGYRLRPRLLLDGRLGYTKRSNGQASFADSDVVVGGVRLRHASPTRRWGVTVQAFDLAIDGRDNNAAVRVNGDFSVLVRERWWLGATARYGAVRYGTELEIKDVDQTAVGATLSRPFGALGQGLLSARVGFGSDDPTISGSRYARDFLTAGLTLGWTFHTRLYGRVAASVEDSDYDQVFFEQRFNEPRSDITYRGRGVLDWRFAPHWRLNHTLSYTLNDTDIDVFEYERFEFGLGLVYEWF